MPIVNGKHYPYTKKGKMAAKRASRPHVTKSMKRKMGFK